MNSSFAQNLPKDRYECQSLPSQFRSTTVKLIYQELHPLLQASLSDITYDNQFLVPTWRFKDSDLQVSNIDYLLVVFLNQCMERSSLSTSNIMLESFFQTLSVNLKKNNISKCVEICLGKEWFSYSKSNLKFMNPQHGSDDGSTISQRNLMDGLVELLIEQHIHNLSIESYFSTPRYEDLLVFFILLLSQGKFAKAYDILIEFASHLILNSFPKSPDEWNNKFSEKRLDMMNKVYYLQVMLNILELSVHDFYSSSIGDKEDVSDWNDAKRLQKQVYMGAKDLILNFKVAIPFISFVVRTSIVYLCSFVRPDCLFVLLQSGFRIDWPSYSTAIRDLEQNWDDLVYSRRHSKADLWRAIAPDDDEGYRYVALITKQECCEALKDKAPGTFLIIPQDLDATSNSTSMQFILTYRTAGTENFKSAIIRRDLQGKDVDERTLDADSKLAKRKRYQYRCGKYGPNCSLLDTLRGISGIISEALIFEPVLPPQLPLKGTKLYSPKLDLNSQFWLDVRDMMPRWLNSVNIEPAIKSPLSKDNDDGEDDYLSDDTSISGGTALSENETGIASSKKHGQGLKNHPSTSKAIGSFSMKALLGDVGDPLDVDSLGELHDSVLYVLTMKAYLSQCVPVAELIQRLYSYDCNQSFPDSDVYKCIKGFDRNMVQIQRAFAIEPSVLFRLAQLRDREPSAEYSVLASILSPIVSFLDNAERNLKIRLQPKLSNRTWQFPIPSHLPTYDHVSSTLLLSLQKDNNSTQLLLPEILVQKLLQAVSPKTIKVPGYSSNFGGIDTLLFDCLSSTELVAVIVRWLECIRALSKAPDSVDILADKDLHDHEDFPGNIFFSPDKNQKAASKSKRVFFSEAEKSGAKLLEYALVSLGIDATAGLEDATAVTGTGTGSATNTSLAVTAEAQAIAHKIICWLEDMRVIQEVVKPADSAFSIPQKYYKYVNFWEVKVLIDPNQSHEKTQLGRRVYFATPVDGPTAAATLRPLLPTSIHQTSAAAATCSSSTASSTAAASVAAAAAAVEAYNIRREALFTLSDSILKRCFSMPYTGTVAAMLRYRDIVREGKIGKSRSRFGPESSVAHVERRKDWEFHYLKLWEMLRAEEYLASIMEQIEEGADQQRLAHIPSESSRVVLYDASHLSSQPQKSFWYTSSDASSPYISSMNQYLYRNGLFARLYMPVRYIAYVQVDIYGLKEILGLAGAQSVSSNDQGAGSFARNISSGNLSSIFNPAGVKPISTIAPQQHVFGANMGQSAGPSVGTLSLTPSSSMHPVSLEVYAAMRLIQFRDSTSDAGTGLYGGSRGYFDGSYITQAQRIEPTPVPLKSKAETSGGLSASRGSEKKKTSGGVFSKQILAQVGRSIDYEWRTQGLFRFPLPEGWLSLLSATKGEEGQERTSIENMGPHTAADIRTPPPMKISITIYEKTFFGENKLGEVELGMSDLSDASTTRDWFPLVQDKSVSWMLYMQAKLRFHLMQLEDLTPIHGEGSSSASPVATGTAIGSASIPGDNKQERSTDSQSSGFPMSPSIGTWPSIPSLGIVHRINSNIIHSEQRSKETHQQQQGGGGGGGGGRGAFPNLNMVINAAKKPNFLSHLDDIF